MPAEPLRGIGRDLQMSVLGAKKTLLASFCFALDPPLQVPVPTRRRQCRRMIGPVRVMGSAPPLRSGLRWSLKKQKKPNGDLSFPNL